MCGCGATEGVSFNEHKSVCDVMLCSQLCRLLEEVINCHSVIQTATARNLSCANFSSYKSAVFGSNAENVAAKLQMCH